MIVHRNRQLTPARDGWVDFVVRFALGGTAVAATYLAVQFLPWPAVGGILAAFPAVLASAVSLSGWRDGDHQAALVAQGAVAGMVGGVAAVGITWVALEQGASLGWALFGGLTGWAATSWAALQARQYWGRRQARRSQTGAVAGVSEASRPGNEAKVEAGAGEVGWRVGNEAEVQGEAVAQSRAEVGTQGRVEADTKVQSGVGVRDRVEAETNVMPSTMMGTDAIARPDASPGVPGRG